MIGPKGIPAEIVQRLNAELNAVLTGAEVRDRLATDGVIAVGGSPEHFMEIIGIEAKRGQDFIQRTGIRLD